MNKADKQHKIRHIQIASAHLSHEYDPGLPLESILVPAMEKGEERGEWGDENKSNIALKMAKELDTTSRLSAL